MNQLGIAVVTSAVQVTLLALFATVCYAIARRRDSAAASWTATTILGTSGLLTLLALCPLPAWWVWRLEMEDDESAATASIASVDGGERQSHVANGEVVTTGEAIDTAPPVFTLRLSTISRWLATMNQPQDAGPNSAGPAQWSVVIACFFLAGAAFCLLRLAVGLWAVRQCCRRSTPVTDPPVQLLLQHLLSELNGPATVAVRETAQLKTAATVGWWRPVVLLPAGWRQWSEPELRAVLAHEIAHICRRDYLAWIAARASMVLNFYHPWVHWMLRRLQLEQELAADACGAQFGGGRDAYLRVLARMALRQEEGISCRPAWPFLPAGGTFLLRRIQMLRNKKSIESGSFRRTGRLITTALLAALAVGLSGLRTPAASAWRRSDDAKTETKSEAAAGNAEDAAPDKAADKRPDPVRLKADADDLIGVFGFRPSVFFNLPGMKPHADFIDKELVEIMQGNIHPPVTVLPIPLPVKEIELVTCPIYLNGPDPNPDGFRRLFFSVEMVRSARDFDWKKFLNDSTPGLTEIELGGKSLLKTTSDKPVFFPFNFLGTSQFYVHDERTVVMPNNVHKLRGMFEAGQEWRSLTESYENWDRVRHGVFALAIDNHDNRVGRRGLKKDDELEPVLAPLFEYTESFALSIEADERMRVVAFFNCKNEEAAGIVAEQIEALLTLARNAARQQLQAEEVDEVRQKNLAIATDLLGHTRVIREGIQVSVQADVKVDLAELITSVIEREGRL